MYDDDITKFEFAFGKEENEKIPKIPTANVM